VVELVVMCRDYMKLLYARSSVDPDELVMMGLLSLLLLLLLLVSSIFAVGGVEVEGSVLLAEFTAVPPLPLLVVGTSSM
jgi:hypothetical protein